MSYLDCHPEKVGRAVVRSLLRQSVAAEAIMSRPCEMFTPSGAGQRDPVANHPMYIQLALLNRPDEGTTENGRSRKAESFGRNHGPEVRSVGFEHIVAERLDPRIRRGLRIARVVILVRDLLRLRPETHPDPAIAAGAKAPEGRLVIRNGGTVPVPACVPPAHPVQNPLLMAVPFIVRHRHRCMVSLDAQHATVLLEVDPVRRGQCRQELAGRVDRPVPIRAERNGRADGHPPVSPLDPGVHVILVVVEVGRGNRSRDRVDLLALGVHDDEALLFFGDVHIDSALIIPVQRGIRERRPLPSVLT